LLQDSKPVAAVVALKGFGYELGLADGLKCPRWDNVAAILILFL